MFYRRNANAYITSFYDNCWVLLFLFTISLPCVLFSALACAVVHIILELLLFIYCFLWSIWTWKLWLHACSICNMILTTFHAGEAHSLKVEKILFQGKSDYQNVIVFQVPDARSKWSFVLVCCVRIYKLLCLVTALFCVFAS